MSTQTFWDRHAPKYAKQPIADMTAYEAKLRRVKSLLRATDHILEVGCGTGGTARALAPSVAQVTATDLSAEMIRIAKARAREEGTPNVSFARAEAGQGTGQASFDAVCAFSLLHLVDDIPALLGTLYAQVKPGGYFLSKTVCLKDGPRWMRGMVRVLMAVGIAPHVTFVSRDALIRQLVAAGFEIVESRYFGKKRINPFIVARRPIA